MSQRSGHESEEQRALDLIREEDGIYQSELWKRLGVSSRKGSRIATSLADAGVIDREEAVHDGQRTYLLTPTDPLNTSASQSVASSDEQDSSSEQQQKDGVKRREQRALELITNSGGIYQSAMWKELDVTSRTGSRIATALAEKGRIEREEAVHNGQRTYFLKPPKRDLNFSLLMAGEELSPFVETNDLDPQDSAFTQWLLQLEAGYEQDSA